MFRTHHCNVEISSWVVSQMSQILRKSPWKRGIPSFAAVDGLELLHRWNRQLNEVTRLTIDRDRQLFGEGVYGASFGVASGIQREKISNLLSCHETMRSWNVSRASVTIRRLSGCKSGWAFLTWADSVLPLLIFPLYKYKPTQKGSQSGLAGWCLFGFCLRYHKVSRTTTTLLRSISRNTQ